MFGWFFITFPAGNEFGFRESSDANSLPKPLWY